MQLQSYASDLLEDAMILAQTKAMNSFSFRDTINTMTELWRYCYEKIAQIDSGFYSRTVQLTGRLTRLPPFVMNTVRVYSARAQVGFGRRVYKQAGMNDLESAGTFHISGNDLYCRDALIRNVFVEYVPEPQFITFTRNNRDPKVLWRQGDREPMPVADYTQRNFGMYRLGDTTHVLNNNQQILDYLNDANNPIEFFHRSGTTFSTPQVDATSRIRRPGHTIVAFILDHPWAFVSYRDDITGEYSSFVSQGVLADIRATQFNPFDFQGRGSNVQYLTAKYNDYTGMGVVVIDHEHNKVVELGWTPDTLLVYPSRIVYNYMVATMASRFAALNGSTIMAVEMALVKSEDEMGLWLKKNKSAWMRADNVTGPTISDFM